jgi:hypothetical protein
MLLGARDLQRKLTSTLFNLSSNEQASSPLITQSTSALSSRPLGPKYMQLYLLYSLCATNSDTFDPPRDLAGIHIVFSSGVVERYSLMTRRKSRG